MSPTLFNVVVDNVIRTFLEMTVEYQRVDHDGLGDTAGRCQGFFYSDDGMVGSRDLDFLQLLMNFLVGLFQSYCLAAYVSKSRTMVCQPGILRSGMPEEAKALKCTGVGDSYWVRLRRRIPFIKSGVDINAGTMTAHRRRMHRAEPAID